MENGLFSCSLAWLNVSFEYSGYLEVVGVGEILGFSSGIQNLWWKKVTVWGSRRCG